VASLDVVMPVHNALPHLDASVGAMLAQTHSSFRLLILENGSTDGTPERLAWWAERDRRITVHSRPLRLGGAASSRAAVELSDTPLVARMDADDVAHPERLARQLAVIEANADAALVATLHGYLDSNGRRVRGLDRWPLAPGSAPMPFSGGCLMFRRDAYERAGGYREVEGTWEDLDLCVRLAEAGRVLVIPQALYWCRFHTTSRTAGKAVEDAVRGAHARGARRAEALLELCSMELWAGERPVHLAELRDAARGEPRSRRLVLLAWARLAELSPAGLRAALRWRSRVRDRIAAAWVPTTKPREWRPR
jgi:GT2 family glycosyltransferase